MMTKRTLQVGQVMFLQLNFRPLSPRCSKKVSLFLSGAGAEEHKPNIRENNTRSVRGSRIVPLCSDYYLQRRVRKGAQRRNLTTTTTKKRAPNCYSAELCKLDPHHRKAHHVKSADVFDVSRSPESTDTRRSRFHFPEHFWAVSRVDTELVGKQQQQQQQRQQQRRVVMTSSCSCGLATILSSAAESADSSRAVPPK